jgi:ABC-2 type transport system ATP-binding protein
LENAINIKNISKEFGGIKALENLTLQIKKGDFFGLIGPNGAGKTTLIMIMLGIIQPSKGEVIINSTNLNKENFNNVEDEIGIVIDHHALYTELTAKENLEFFSEIYNTKLRAEEFLKLMGLWERKDDKISEFSKGMKQRVAIARALLKDPSILILDEPLDGLDPESRKFILTFLNKLNKEHEVTIFLTSHNLYDVQELCSSIGIIKKGKIIKLDSTYNLINNNVNKSYLIRFKDKPDRDKLNRILKEDVVNNLFEKNNNEMFIQLKAGYSVNYILEKIINEKIYIEEFTRTDNALEDVYMNLIGGE